MKKQKTLAIFTTDQGHKSISDTIAATLKPGFNVQIYSDDNFMFAGYIYVYRFFPSITRLPFLFFKNPVLRQVAATWLDWQYRTKIKNLLAKHQPDVVINAFWMFRPSLDALLKNTSTQYLTVVTDPWSVHPFVASTVSQTNLAFDDKTARAIKKIVPQAQVDSIGWFVRDNFEQPFVKTKVRAELGLAEKKLTLLFTTGSEGTESIFPVVSDLMQTKLPVQIIVACGNNQHLLERFTQLKNTAPTYIDLHAIPFTTQLHLYMQAADLVIGKAGPNSVFEAVACQTPFFASTHIAGQEDGNLEIIRQLKLGYVEEDPIKAAQLLHQIISQPDQLRAFQPQLEALAEYNRQAKIKLRKLLTEKIEKAEKNEAPKNYCCR